MLTIRLERGGIEGLESEPSAVRPAREAVGPAQEVLDTASLIATRLEPAQEGIEVGTGGGRR